MPDDIIDMVRKRQEAEALAASVERTRKTEAMREHFMAAFHQTVDEFLQYVDQNDYPFAIIQECGDQPCLAYPLFGTHRSDGEDHLDAEPLTLLITSNKDVYFSFGQQTHHPQLPADTSAENQTLPYVHMPVTLDEFAARPKYPNMNESYYFYEHELIRWAVRLKHYVQAAEESKTNPGAHPASGVYARRRADDEHALAEIST